MAVDKVCTVEGCGRKYFSTGLCIAHYRRKERGSPLDKAVQVRLLNQITFSVRIPEEYHSILERTAADQKTTIVALARKILMEYVDANQVTDSSPASAKKPKKRS